MRKIFSGRGTIFSMLVLVAIGGERLLAQPASIPTSNEYRVDVPPRLQWNENDGYCGETSFISAGLHFGQYCSQFTARSIASPGVNQSDPSSQLLLGVNDGAAALKMRLKAAEFYSPTQRSTKDFLSWVKSRVLAGDVVIIGVFNNGVILEEWTGRRQGDSEYDHIVPVLGYGSNSSLTRFSTEALASDVITISDNGLYGPFGTPPVYQFEYAFRIRSFPGTREQANRPRGPVYMLKNRPENYGIAIEGVLDLEGVTVPVRLRSSSNTEPQIAHHSNTPPVPVPIQLTATVTIPDPSVGYNLYRYDDFSKVPVAGFNAAVDQAAEVWEIAPHAGSEIEVTVDTLSDATVIFRAVPASAP